jgi:D-2-hydroxyacid dehydrogenase (NADP+)
MTRRFDVIHACVTSDRGVRKRIDAALGPRRVEHVEPWILEEALPAIDVLLCSEAPSIDWSGARRLRLLQLMGSGIERLWPARGLPEDVAIAGARGIHLPEMRDHALALMLAFERNLFAIHDNQRLRRWAPCPGGTLSGKTVAILGLGEIGRSVAAGCTAFGMRVIGVRARPRPTPHVDDVRSPEALFEVLSAADQVVVLLPRTDRTIGLLDGQALARMKHSAVLIHLSRGGIVDEEALSAALREDRLRGAALDVFAEEPLPAQSPLWRTPRLLITPHVAGLVADYIERALALFRENLERVEGGAAPKTSVDRTLGY